jgi:hypothetical protein
MIMYAHLGVICLILFIHHDPAARMGLFKFLSSISQESIRGWWIKNLFLDPAGRIGRLSQQISDPRVSESRHIWSLVHEKSDERPSPFEMRD